MLDTISDNEVVSSLHETFIVVQYRRRYASLITDYKPLNIDYELNIILIILHVLSIIAEDLQSVHTAVENRKG